MAKIAKLAQLTNRPLGQRFGQTICRSGKAAASRVLSLKAAQKEAYRG